MNHRIGIFGRNTTPYDLRMMHGLATGFALAGHGSYVENDLLSCAELLRRCATEELDLVLEINRSRSQSPEFSAKFSGQHIAWLQDARDISGDGAGSDLTYSVSPVMLGYAADMKVLSYGADPVHAAGHTAARLSDFCFVGYIGQASRYPAAVVEAFTASFRPADRPLTLADYQIGRVPELDRYHHLARSVVRARLVRAALSVSQSVRLFGPATWTGYDEFRPYYRGFLDSDEEVYAAYRTSRLTVHDNINGCGLHSRVIECMAAGGALLVEETPCDELPGGIKTEFEPFVDYIPFSIHTAGQTMREWLAQPRLERIAAHAQAKVLARHTWKHRAQQIIADLNL